jgi:hypothetical protein
MIADPIAHPGQQGVGQAGGGAVDLVRDLRYWGLLALPQVRVVS